MVYGATAYLLLPWAWTHYEHQRGLARLPMVTATAQGIPGDPLNVGLVGSREEVVRAMTAAGWFAADPITWRTSIEIVGSVLLDRPYRDAPVSPLFYDGRREDLAFEKPAATSPDRRNHVRFWKVLETGQEGRPVWLGSATFDRSVGLSHLTGAVTHHIAPDIDAERELLAANLEATGMVERRYTISGVGPTLFGRNGEGDRYYTDGEILVSVLTPDGEPRSEAADRLPPPTLVGVKNKAFARLRSALPRP
ncbi:LssY C-terminal domain-containing protein [Enterovirga sp. CN4-39]|uniref:LssY C-terminal domain-containing protein n=1 Tax=Enterovirga sp. CN4-39 TaxID=3400910 RepID=UPI003BFE1F90